ncbi:hypothetical protein HRI_003221800 [Hibiscus trionum]|uniref:CCHC-type domain-containing protein n=1 Tax=Hibiscus trionum TaxID=183268 RepID=A0A9W7MER4_HIBTR|nr:hypothetical protein HRI_003221800 [Hibiscus trionum]
MASTSNIVVWGDSQPTNKPPFFNGVNYAYWKNRMKLFIQAYDLEAWKIIMRGYIAPTSNIESWSVEEDKGFSTNAKAMHLIFCALGPDEYGRVSSCSNAKEIWDKLEVTHEGTNQVKETKIGLLNLSYENFKMDPEEDIKTMSDRFSVIVNGLKGYGEVIPEDKLVRKMIYSLPDSWDSKKTAIIEAKDLKVLKLDELIGSLLTHEMMSTGKEEKKKEVEKKKVGLALKASKKDDDSSEEDEEKEMAMFAKRFKNFMLTNKGRRFQRDEGFKSNKGRDPLTCYECNKPGHIRFDCPQLKKNSYEKKKHKAHVATWSDDESSDEDEDEVANLCLMAIEDDSMVTSNSSYSFDYTFDELQDVYNELALEYEKLILKNRKITSKLKNENDSLSKSNMEFESKIKEMQVQIKDFEKRNQDLQNLLSKVHEDHQKELDDLKASFNKVGTKLVEKCENSRPNYVRKNYHGYRQRSPNRKKIRSIWVPKGLIANKDVDLLSKWIPKGTKLLGTNSYGPKRVWVPKHT